ncbi:MAG: hypothetical protein ACOYK8_00995 [Alphaproteobacteria bacterium]
MHEEDIQDLSIRRLSSLEIAQAVEKFGLQFSTDPLSANLHLSALFNQQLSIDNIRALQPITLPSSYIPRSF